MYLVTATESQSRKKNLLDMTLVGQVAELVSRTQRNVASISQLLLYSEKY